MSRRVWVGALTTLAWAGYAQAASWYLANADLIHANGTIPSVWGRTVANLDGSGGPVMFYDGTQSILVHDPQVSDWEPANGNGSVACRNVEYGTANKEIFRWDGTFPIQVDNVSNSAAIDSDLSAGGNGDLIWTRRVSGGVDRWLYYYYDESSDAATPLGCIWRLRSAPRTATKTAWWTWMTMPTSRTLSLGPSRTRHPDVDASISTKAATSIWRTLPSFSNYSRNPESLRSASSRA